MKTNKQEPLTTINVRVPVSLKLALERLTLKQSKPGARKTLSDIIRALIEAGMRES
jgi:hypothetical protein